MAIPVLCSFLSTCSAEEVWLQLNDIESVAQCLPGAVLTGRAEPSGYLGHISVKLGPVNFRFKGQFSFLEIFNDERRAVAFGKGSDEKGRGTVNAQVTFQVAQHDKQALTTISANIELSGMVAQFGRSGAMIQAVSETLVNEFAKNLELLMSYKQGPPKEQSETPEANRLAADPPPANALYLLLSTLKNLLKNLFQRRS